MSSPTSRPVVQLRSVAGFLATIPHLLGFHPARSLVIVGVTAGGRVQVAFRYDLPDPPTSRMTRDMTRHILAVLGSQDLAMAVVAGYGPGRLVTPLADALRAAAPRAGVRLQDVLRVEDGRYWSYLCTDPACCPAEGVVFDPATDPAGRAMAAVERRPVLPDREAVEAMIAPVSGEAATRMREFTGRVEQAAAELVAREGQQALIRRGRQAVSAALDAYAGGRRLHRNSDYVWLGLTLRLLPVRDDAWARLDPEHAAVYQDLWRDVVRHVQPGYVAAPASLLAVTAWQTGDGALANIALDRALADQPGYSLALLLADILAAGTPPSAAVPPMTPEQVAEAYAMDGESSARDTKPATTEPAADGDPEPGSPGASGLQPGDGPGTGGLEPGGTGPAASS
jgi:Domain of unknown function (DUF4192)